MFRCTKWLKNSVLPIVILMFFFQKTEAQIRINEILTLNSSLVDDPDFGEFADYIELHNHSENAVNLKDFTLTDNPENQSKWSFPELIMQPDEYLLLWTDGKNKLVGDTAFSKYRNATINVTLFHLNFGLSGNGEYLGLFNNDQQLIDEVWFGVQQHDASYGRNPDNPSEWYYFGDATPGSRNSGYGATQPIFSSAAQFSIPGGFYHTSQQLNISGAAPGAEIRFTIDGSVPNHTAPLFTEPFNLFRNFTIKARVYEQGKLPGPIVTHTYFIGENIDLPVISVSTNNNNLWGFDFGLFRNSIKDREVPAVIEYFDKNGQPGFSDGIGLRIFGSTIYQLPQKPMSIRFKPKYGEPELNYPLFPNRENERYKSFLLRNGGNDHNLAYFRDGLAMNLAKTHMDLDFQEYQPCVVFINGEYQGIYEIRERLDNDYLANNHQMSSANIDLLEDSLSVSAGDNLDFRNLLSYIESNDLASIQNYEYIASKIDLNEFINYMIHKIFVGYWMFDLNSKYWREREDSAKWRWIAGDMEHAFGQLSGDNYWENTLGKVSGVTSDLSEWSTFLFKKLLTNNAFRDEFAQRFAVYLNTIYQPDATISKVDSLQKLFTKQMPRHINKWKTPLNLAVWQGNIQFIREYLTNRPAHLRTHIAQQFGLADSALMNLNIVGKGKVSVSGVWFSEASNNGDYFKGAGVKMHAVPNPGFKFAGWLGLDNNNPELTIQLTGDTSITARFEPDSISIIPSIIDTDTVLTAKRSPWYGTGDVTVMAGAKLTIEAGVEILMADQASITVHGGMSILGTSENQVTIKPDPSPAARHPNHNNKPRWGVICAVDATDTIRIKHALISGSGFGKNRNKHFATISAFNSNVMVEHTQITNNIQPFYSEYGSVYIGNSSFRSNNTCDLINVKYTTKAIVEGCDLKGNKAPDTDAIDFDGVIDGIIRNNKIYSFWGSNSDGIDLGEASKNLIIENNHIYDCTDKAISVGQATTVQIRRNLIHDCDMGVAVKDSNSFAMVDQNTFYANNYAIASYEKNSGKGGGNATVKNVVIAGSLTASLLVDRVSTLKVSYSISDTDSLPGTGNLFADPLFVHATTGNFELQPESPCIDKGDPLSAPDPDQSRADMGAYYTHSGNSGLTVHINEVNYHSASNYDTGDWIEIYNTTKSLVNISNWSLNDRENRFKFPKGVFINPGEYLVVGEDSVRFKAHHPNVINFMDGRGFELNNKSGHVYLMNADNQPVHSVRYGDNWPWPPLADGKGATLELEHSQEGNSPVDWRESYLLMGSPGASNSFPIVFSRICINELMASNNSIPDEYSEFDDWFEVYNPGDTAVNVGGLYFTDNFIEPNKWQLPLNYPDLTTIEPKGFLLIWADDQTEQGPFHTSFKLSASGEELAVYQRFHYGYYDLDRIVFGEQNKTQSFGRFTDGAEYFSLMKPTPGKSNTITSIDDDFSSDLTVYPNPFKDYTRFVTAGIAKPFQIEVYNLTGNLVWKSGSRMDNTVMLERGSLNTGWYIYRVIPSDGRHISGKLIVY